MNVNDLATTVTLKEGKAKSVSVAQVKEVIGITLRKLAELPEAKLLKTVKRFKGKK